MTKLQAMQAGRAAAEEVARHGDFSPEAQRDEDRYIQEASEIEENSRQFAGHISYEISRERNSEALFDAYEEAFGQAIARWAKQTVPQHMARQGRGGRNFRYLAVLHGIWVPVGPDIPHSSNGEALRAAKRRMEEMRKIIQSHGLMNVEVSQLMDGRNGYGLFIDHKLEMAAVVE